MAKFTPGAIISEIRGSIAAVTYSRSRAGAISKAKLIQTNPNSSAQQAIRAIQAAAVAAWQLLSEVNQQLWIAFASTQNSRPRIDGTHKLCGYNAFIRFYNVRNQYGLSGNPAPKHQTPVGNYSDMSFTATSESLDFTITGDNVDPDVFVIVRMSDALSPGISSVNQSLLVIIDQITAPNGVLAADLLPEWEARYGPIANANDMKIFARLDIVNRLTAQRTTVFRESVFVQIPSVFVAVANSGVGDRVMTSLNGVLWTSRVSSHDGNWLAVAYSPSLELFVAIAGGGAGERIMTSPDGVTWTSRTGAQTIQYQAVTWSPGLNLFVAIASDGSPTQTIYSSDGINWTVGVTVQSNAWTSISWSPALSLFVTVSRTGTGDRVMTSLDGISWTLRVSAADNNWRSVAWSPGLNLFCAVATTGVGNRVMTSPDGITWTIRTSAADNSWVSVAWSPGLNLFCAVAFSGVGNRVMTSPDGITWTIRTSAADNNWFSIVWSPTSSLFVAVANTGVGNRVMTSPDGITWTIRTSATDNNWRGVIAAQ